MTRKENITAILECNFAGFSKEIIEGACNRILELEPFINKPCVSKGACNEDKIKALDKISAEIERQENWLRVAECNAYNAYNVDIAFNSIKRVLKEMRDEE